MPHDLESNPILSEKPSVLGILEDPTLTSATKADYFELFLRTPVTKKRDYFRRWGVFTSKEVGGILTHTQARKVVEKFVAFHNLSSTNEGERSGHNTLTGFMFSDLFLPAIMAIHEYGERSNDIDALRQSSLALLILNDTLDILQTKDPRSLRDFDKENLLLMEQIGSTDTILQPFDDHTAVRLAETLPQLHIQSMTGRNTDLQNLYCLMALSRLTAFQAIQANHNKPAEIDQGIKLPKGVIINDFNSLASQAERHFLEMENGIDFPEDTLSRIDQSKVLAVSIDWNSVWNMSESYANSHMIALTTETIKQLSNDFHQRFPDKEILFVMNTGRPAHYAWGVIEALSVIKELRIMAFAESGGVILKTGMTKGETEVAVDNPKHWEAQLEALKNHLLDRIKNPLGVHIEPKQSMLSIKLADQDISEGPWLHESVDGQAINPEWVTAETSAFLNQKQKEIQDEQKKLFNSLQNEQLEIKVLDALKTLGDAGADGKVDTNDDISAEDLARIADIFDEASERRGARLIELRASLQTINLMIQKLNPAYNSRAGFIDIGHKDLNKYSTLIGQLGKKFGYQPNEIVTITIGDSKTDILPTSETGDGQVNRGADEVIGVAVGNASLNLKEATESRRIKNNRGVQTVTDSILGLISMIKGLNRVINKF